MINQWLKTLNNSCKCDGRDLQEEKCEFNHHFPIMVSVYYSQLSLIIPLIYIVIALSIHLYCVSFA